MGTNVLAIKYKSGDPNQAALIANAFLASTIDGSVAMKAAAADQTARWFAPQIEELRKDVEGVARGRFRPSRPRQTWWRRPKAAIAKPASTWRSASS